MWRDKRSMLVSDPAKSATLKSLRRLLRGFDDEEESEVFDDVEDFEDSEESRVTLGEAG